MANISSVVVRVSWRYCNGTNQTVWYRVMYQHNRSALDARFHLFVQHSYIGNSEICVHTS